MLLFALSGLLAAAPAPPDSARLSGRVAHAPATTWAYVYPPGGDTRRRVCLDSARLDAKGRFALRVPLTQGPERYNLQFSGEAGYWPVPLAPGRLVQFEGDLRPSGPVKVSTGHFRGSPETELDDAFMAAYRTALSSKRAGKHDKALAAQARARQLVRRHPDSFLAAWWTSAFLTQDTDQRVFVDSMTTVLRQRLPDSRYTRALLRRQQQQVALQPGQPAPAFALATALGGDSLRLASLRGRYVVLHFWYLYQASASVRLAPGSRPADLLPLYHWAQGRPVELVSVAFTPDQLRWLAEVQREPGVSWPQAADARGYRGPLAESYGVNKAPGFVLIGPDAQLLGLGLDLDEVEKQLRQLLP
ncbi:hypothetical protein EJV47_24315 [Hymenobacter gummosus]|uniref:Thioredoxin domain-containing protein n=1 Tax=Hymenobacter gummosus TaxID=1776032 RepID=A0A431TW88_9BACT|nr:hypothetical protein [Hymenobacter gummosus]RTQ45619.1 hypothetical protein EJV47_24315 [Hymenobacter gummosus]